LERGEDVGEEDNAIGLECPPRLQGDLDRQIDPL
jgi:hypothetical protein